MGRLAITNMMNMIMMNVFIRGKVLRSDIKTSKAINIQILKKYFWHLMYQK